jgi:hypothetical protein
MSTASQGNCAKTIFLGHETPCIAASFYLLTFFGLCCFGSSKMYQYEAFEFEKKKTNAIKSL